MIQRFFTDKIYVDVEVDEASHNGCRLYSQTTPLWTNLCQISVTYSFRKGDWEFGGDVYTTYLCYLRTRVCLPACRFRVHLENLKCIQYNRTCVRCVEIINQQVFISVRYQNPWKPLFGVLQILPQNSGKALLSGRRYFRMVKKPLIQQSSHQKRTGNMVISVMYVNNYSQEQSKTKQKKKKAPNVRNQNSESNIRIIPQLQQFSFGKAGRRNIFRSSVTLN